MTFALGTIVDNDLDYNDYRLFAKWIASGVYFITRMKDNTQFEVVEERKPPQNRSILKDQIIRLTGTGAQEICPYLLRHIEAMHEDKLLEETKTELYFTEHGIRAKCASEAETLAHAQQLLAHADERTAEQIYRRKPEPMKMGKSK